MIRTQQQKAGRQKIGAPSPLPGDKGQGGVVKASPKGSLSVGFPFLLYPSLQKQMSIFNEVIWRVEPLE